MILLGYDIGSSSVKASLVDAESGVCLDSASYPDTEAPIGAPRPGFAEQRPEDWWSYLKAATARLYERERKAVGAIGISYQMHGLVCVDKDLNPLRPAIIWCDSRAVPYGNRAFEQLGAEWCLEHLLNSPGNFTAAKLAWVKENEPEVFAKIDRILLPGDWMAAKMTGEVCTTVSGLSEGIFWDFKENAPSKKLLDAFGFSQTILPEIVPTFAEQGRLKKDIAEELGLRPGTPVTYRAGDQPNNALSLNVFNPGEIASTAGTSGVVYGVSGTVAHDPLSRVNCFAHVNHGAAAPRLGVLLCINGTGILNAWMRRNIVPEGMSYQEMDAIAAGIPAGSDGVCILPFGNGAERVLGNREVGCSLHGIDFNRHTRAHLLRAAQEGIAFSMRYGIGIMEEMGVSVRKIHAGKANLFLSDIFRQTLADTTGAVIELYDTDGAAGAARGAGIGAGIYKNTQEAFASLERVAHVEPQRRAVLDEAYEKWISMIQ